MNTNFRTNFFPYRAVATILIIMLALLALPVTPAYALTCTATATGNWSAAGTWSGCSGGVPGAGDDVIINNGITVTVTANAPVNSISFANTSTTNSTLTVDTGVVLNVTNGITVPNAASSSRAATLVGAGTINTASLTVGGTTTAISGDSTTTLTSTISTLSLSGNLNVNGEDTSNSQNNATFNLGSGTVSVGGSVVLDADDDGGSASSATLTLATGSQDGTLTLSGATPFSTPSTGTATFTANGTSATVVYSGTAQTVQPVPYRNLTLSGSGAKTLTSVTTINGNLTLSGTATASTAGNTSIGGNLDVGSGTTFTVIANNTLSVGGTTSVSGTLTLAGTGTKTFTGNVTVNNGGTWNETGTGNITDSGNLQNDGTYTANTGTHTFSGTAKTISGANAVAIPNLTISGTTTNNGTLTVSTALAGGSTLTNGASGTLNYGGSSITPTLTATAVGNTVNYTAAGAQSVKATAYSNLIFSGSGAKSMASGTSVASNLSIAPTGTATANIAAGQNLTVNSLTLGGFGKNSGTWGGTTSGATNINTTYFAATTGRLTVTTDTRLTQATLTVNDPSPVTYGSSPTLSSTGGSAGAVTFSSGASTGCSVAGSTLTVTSVSGTCNITATRAGDSDYKPITSAVVSVTLQKATPTATLAVNNSPVTYDGTPKSATVGITLSSVPGTVSNILTGGAASQTSASSYAVTADFVPTDATNYNTLTGLSAGNFVINKATPTATLAVNNSPVTYDGTPKSATVGITVSSVSGSVSNVLTGGAASQTNTNSYTVTADFVPTDSANYNTLTGLSAGNFVINKATPTAILAVNNSPVTYDGTPKSATVGITVSSVPGSVSNILTGGATSQTSASSYAVTADFVPTDSANYNTLTGLSAGNFVISKAAADCSSIAGYSVTYDGNPHTAIGTCQGVGSDGTLSGLNLALTTHTEAGAYNGDAWSFTDVSGNYNDTVGTVDNSIAKANPTLSVTNSPVTYTGLGQAATVGAGSVAGSASNILTGGLATQTNAGTYAVTADFTPSDTTNYNSLVAAPAGNFVINPAAATITVNGYTGTYDGLPHGASLVAATGVNSEDLTASVSLGSAFTDVPGGTANWSFANGNYVSQNGSASIVINSAAPILSVTNSPIIFNGAPQSATLSSGLATGVISNIQYDGSATAPTAVGSYAVTADFTSSDPNYTDLTGASAGSFVITAKLIPTVTASGGPFDYDGAPHAATVVGSVPGTVSNVKYNNSGTVPTHTGTYSVTADFVPTDTVTYENLLDAAAGSITINKVGLTVTANNQSINAGEPDPTFTISYSGFVNGETAAVLNSAPTCGVSVPHVDPGTYPIVCSGGADDNYSFSYVNGTLSVGVTGGGPGGGADTTGVFRPINGLLYLKNSNDTGFADYALNYGLPGDYPVVGDWDGNGTVTIGIYRGHTFFLRNENTLGFATIVFDFGQDGDQPIAGDWDGDGIDTIGIFRPSNGQFMLRNSNDTGPASATFFLGNPGDVGIAGDWNGDGKDSAGVFRPSNGIIFLKDTNDTGFANYALNYGLPGDKPVMGDWDNDGVDTIGIYRNGTFYLRNENTNGFATIVFGLGNPGDMPIAGNWDGLP